MIRFILSAAIIVATCAGLASVSGTPLDALFLPLGCWAVAAVTLRPMLTSFDDRESSSGDATGFLALGAIFLLLTPLAWAALVAVGVVS